MSTRYTKTRATVSPSPRIASTSIIERTDFWPSTSAGELSELAGPRTLNYLQEKSKSFVSSFSR